MDKKEEFLLSNLYINKVSITREIPMGNYLKELPVVKNLMQTGGIRFHKPVTFLVGENGVGKSTLIEAIAVACGFNPEGGTINFNFSTRSSHSDLHNYLTISRGYKKHRDGFFLRAESFYNVASNIEDMDDGVSLGAPVISSYGGVSLHKQSHGESFMSLVENRFGGNGIYILDEPEAALSPMRMMRLLCYIQKLVNDNSQFIISTHSPILMTFPNAEILEITEDGINSVNYKETEHFLITKRFMDAPEKMIESLLD
ncbi:MAG: AAA family ATPase [Alphaproteobacteria bacterium]|nr:AAA family ATPase [Alphaproteobacteria bacterium]MBQ2922807.1 AAA family ATPase [Tyzzerella sp.]